ncbi:MAG TPA: AAC(3) family N-acetyltransferase [Planctomycetota bacterium]|nr:AAC(3) family N-acetyltransferase [Planctomycetota bacterium]
MSDRPLQRDDLVRDLRQRCAIRPGAILIVHASLKAIGRVEGGAATVVAALQEALTTSGTLLMPTFSHPTRDGVWRMADTPSRTGAVTEALRTGAGAVRSLHPTHSVTAWGARAGELTEGHERTSGLGVGSPFHRAVEAGADLLMIGCDLTSCSLVHVAEALVRAPYLGRVFYDGYERDLTAFDRAGRQRAFPPVDVPTDSAGFVVVQQALEKQRAIAHVGLGEAPCLRFTGRACLDAAVVLLRADPAALLCASPTCAVCIKARTIVRGG